MRLAVEKEHLLAIEARHAARQHQISGNRPGATTCFVRFETQGCVPGWRQIGFDHGAIAGSYPIAVCHASRIGAKYRHQRRRGWLDQSCAQPIHRDVARRAIARVAIEHGFYRVAILASARREL
ncbi:hypothetical protein D3C85_862300 [compost metagenome]